MGNRPAGTNAPADKGPATVSMTGFGKASVESEVIALEAETKAVNNRFLDIIFKLPKVYTQFEQDLRNLVTSKVSRGRIEIYVGRTERLAGEATLQFREGLFDSAYALARRLVERSGPMSGESHTRIVLNLLGRKEILELAEEGAAADEEKALLLDSVSRAIDELVKMRKVEGKKIGQDISSRLETLRSIRSSIMTAASSAPDDLRNRLTTRLAKLAPDVQIDPARLTAEVALLADRIDVTEELVRLESHFKQFSETLGATPNGRKLDFLIQELGREFNTIGSKAQDAAVQSLVVDAKVELEKMREQVQNVE